MHKKGLIVLPSYNERMSVVSLCQALRRELPDLDLLVIDDGSSDETDRMLAEHGFDYLQHPQNLGYVEALRSGLMVSILEERPFICFFDADGQHRVEDLCKMITEFKHRNQTGSLDILLASRFLHPAGKPTSFVRGLGNRFFCSLLRFLTKRTFSDVSNGLKILSPKAAKHMSTLPLEDAHAELLFSAVRNGFTIDEYPVVVLPREQGKSMITFLKALWYPMRTLLAVIILYRLRPSNK